MKYIDKTEFFKMYADKWVAMSDDEKVISSGDNPDMVLLDAKKKGFDNPFITRIFNPNNDYLFA